jgi:hypothetical protein
MPMTTKMKLEMTSSLTKNDLWWKSEWYKKERQMIEDDRRSQEVRPKLGRWVCYYGMTGELIYEYVNM